MDKTPKLNEKVAKFGREYASLNTQKDSMKGFYNQHVAGKKQYKSSHSVVENMLQAYLQSQGVEASRGTVRAAKRHVLAEAYNQANDGRKKKEIYASLKEQFGVSETTIRRAVKDYNADVYNAPELKEDFHKDEIAAQRAAQRDYKQREQEAQTVTPKMVAVGGGQHELVDGQPGFTDSIGTAEAGRARDNPVAQSGGLDTLVAQASRDVGSADSREAEGPTPGSAESQASHGSYESSPGDSQNLPDSAIRTPAQDARAKSDTVIFSDVLDTPQRSYLSTALSGAGSVLAAAGRGIGRAAIATGRGLYSIKGYIATGLVCATLAYLPGKFERDAMAADIASLRAQIAAAQTVEAEPRRNEIQIAQASSVSPAGQPVPKQGTPATGGTGQDAPAQGTAVVPPGQKGPKNGATGPKDTDPTTGGGPDDHNAGQPDTEAPALADVVDVTGADAAKQGKKNAAAEKKPATTLEATARYDIGQLGQTAYTNARADFQKFVKDKYDLDIASATLKRFRKDAYKEVDKAVHNGTFDPQTFIESRIGDYLPLLEAFVGKDKLPKAAMDKDKKRENLINKLTPQQIDNSLNATAREDSKVYETSDSKRKGAASVVSQEMVLEDVVAHTKSVKMDAKKLAALKTKYDQHMVKLVTKGKVGPDKATEWLDEKVDFSQYVTEHSQSFAEEDAAKRVKIVRAEKKVKKRDGKKIRYLDSTSEVNESDLADVMLFGGKINGKNWSGTVNMTEKAKALAAKGNLAGARSLLQEAYTVTRAAEISRYSPIRKAGDITEDRINEIAAQYFGKKEAKKIEKAARKAYNTWVDENVSLDDLLDGNFFLGIKSVGWKVLKGALIASPWSINSRAGMPWDLPKDSSAVQQHIREQQVAQKLTVKDTGRYSAMPADIQGQLKAQSLLRQRFRELNAEIIKNPVMQRRKAIAIAQLLDLYSDLARQGGEREVLDTTTDLQNDWVDLMSDTHGIATNRVRTLYEHKMWQTKKGRQGLMIQKLMVLGVPVTDAIKMAMTGYGIFGAVNGASGASRVGTNFNYNDTGGNDVGAAIAKALAGQ